MSYIWLLYEINAPAPRDVRDLLSNGETNVLEGSGNSIFKLEYLQNENSDLDAVKSKMF